MTVMHYSQHPRQPLLPGERTARMRGKWHLAAGSQPIRLLLLDESGLGMSLLAQRLWQEGVMCTAAHAANEAQLRQALRQRWDLILFDSACTDCTPGMVHAVLAHARRTIPLMVLTEDVADPGLASLLQASAGEALPMARLGRLSHALRLVLDRARLIRRLQARTNALTRASLELIKTQEYERKALARELHDEFGQRLTSVTLLLHRARACFQSPQAHDLWEQTQSELTEMANLVRTISGSLRPPALELLGPERAIGQLMARQFERGPRWHFSYSALPPRLDPVLEISLFRLAQEGITNILRHSSASNVVMEICGAGGSGELSFALRDDGVGFEPLGWPERAACKGSAGLSGMRERVQLLGGIFLLQSAPGAGTRIRVTLPFVLPA